MTGVRYHGGRQPSSDDSFHSPIVIPPSALDKLSTMKGYHPRRTTRWGVTARLPTMVTLHDTWFVECRWWNDGWTVKTFVTWRSSASMIPAPEYRGTGTATGKPSTTCKSWLQGCKWSGIIRKISTAHADVWQFPPWGTLGLRFSGMYWPFAASSFTLISLTRKQWDSREQYFSGLNAIPLDEALPPARPPRWHSG